MKLLNKVFKTNQRGMLHLHIVLPVLLAVMAIGGIGAYVLNSSNANTASVCGALYNTNKVVSKTDANWDAASNDPSVKNMAFALCKLKDSSGNPYLNVTTANKINQSSTGKFYAELKPAIKKFQLSKAQLKGDPDGYPGPLTACLMGLTPTGFSNNSCASVTKPNIAAVADPAVPKPAVTFTTSAASVKTGSTATLSWKAAGINVTCTSNIPTVPTPAVSGSYVYKMPDATAHTFTLTCKNPGGSTPVSVKVTGVAATATTPPATTPAPAPGTIVYTGNFECTVGASFTEAGVAWYPVTVTNKTDKATSTLTEINMRGVRADGTWTSFNGTTPATSAANFKWVSGFSGAKMLVNTPVKFNIKTNNMLQDKWILSISGKQYDCAKAVVAPTVNTAPYTTLPGTPATNSSTYATWLAWSNAVKAENAKTSKLTGQALIDKLKPFKDAYDAQAKLAASLSCNATFPAQITIGKPVSSSLAVTNKSTTALAAGAYKAQLSEKYSGSTAPYRVISGNTTPAIAINATGSVATTSPKYDKMDGKKITLSYTLVRASDNAVVANCNTANAFKTYDLSSGAQTATPASDKPAAVVVVGKPPVIATPAPTAPAPSVAKKVADLGYSAKLYCVTKAKNGNLTVAKCADANALVLAVNGTNKDPAKNKLSYGVDVTKTKTDKFGTVNSCAPRTLITAGKDLTYDCTVLYTNQSFFTGMKAAVVNRFNSIINKAKAQTFLNKSEAKAAIDKLKKEDLVTLDTRITLSYPKYTSQVIDGPNLVLDYDEANAVQRIKNIQEADCIADGGTFISVADGCDKPAPTPAGGNSGGSSGSSGSGGNSGCTKNYYASDNKLCTDSRAEMDKHCAAIGQKWYQDDCHSAKYITDHTKKTFLPNAAARKDCQADRGQYKLGVTGWYCQYPKVVPPPAAKDCVGPRPLGYVWTISNGKCTAVPGLLQQNNPWSN